MDIPLDLYSEIISFLDRKDILNYVKILWNNLDIESKIALLSPLDTYEIIIIIYILEPTLLLNHYLINELDSRYIINIDFYCQIEHDIRNLQIYPYKYGLSEGKVLYTFIYPYHLYSYIELLIAIFLFKHDKNLLNTFIERRNIDNLFIGGEKDEFTELSPESFPIFVYYDNHGTYLSDSIRGEIYNYEGDVYGYIHYTGYEYISGYEAVEDYGGRPPPSNTYATYTVKFAPPHYSGDTSRWGDSYTIENVEGIKMEWRSEHDENDDFTEEYIRSSFSYALNKLLKIEN